MKHKYLHNTLLAAVLLLALIVCLIFKAFSPLGVLPQLDIPNMVLLSLVALVLQQYLCPAKRGLDILSFLLAAATFGLLPFAAGFAALAEIWKLALIGGVVFFLTAWLYEQMTDRIATGPLARLAPIFSALGLYLAAQCFAGILL